MNTTRLAMLLLFCASSLVGQREELPTEPLSVAQYEKLAVLTGGMPNGNAWVHLFAETRKLDWMTGFTDGLAAPIFAECGDCCPKVWPRANPSKLVMIAELDTFYATRENRLIPMVQALVSISKKRNGEMLEAEWDRYVQVLRDVAAKQ